LFTLHPLTIKIFRNHDYLRKKFTLSLSLSLSSLLTMNALQAQSTKWAVGNQAVEYTTGQVSNLPYPENPDFSPLSYQNKY
jgi:hypothetical protein